VTLQLPCKKSCRLLVISAATSNGAVYLATVSGVCRKSDTVDSREDLIDTGSDAVIPVTPEVYYRRLFCELLDVAHNELKYD